jgi:hypothetical protein
MNKKKVENGRRNHALREELLGKGASRKSLPENAKSPISHVNMQSYSNWVGFRPRNIGG